MKHSLPDIANAVQELSKVLDGASPAAFKEMNRLIKYVLDTKNLGLKLEPNLLKKRPVGIWTDTVISIKLGILTLEVV